MAPATAPAVGAATPPIAPTTFPIAVSIVAAGAKNPRRDEPAVTRKRASVDTDLAISRRNEESVNSSSISTMAGLTFSIQIFSISECHCAVKGSADSPADAKAPVASRYRPTEPLSSSRKSSNSSIGALGKAQSQEHSRPYTGWTRIASRHWIGQCT
jgi:hypothetical protein